MLHSRLKQLRNHSQVLLHQCPREYELSQFSAGTYELGNYPSEAEDPYGHLTFGILLGNALQYVWQGLPKQDVIWKLFMECPDIFYEMGTKDRKLFWDAIYALDKFEPFLHQLQQTYELVSFNGRPACELRFIIRAHSGYNYRGSIDLVLRHRHTRQLCVFEIKTTKYNTVNPAYFRNSGQGLGYSLILDQINQQEGISEGSSFEILYFIYKTVERTYEPLPFLKHHLQRAIWLKQLFMDIERLESYGQHNLFPMHGESCVRFNRTCKFFEVCEMSKLALVGDIAKIPEFDESKLKYDFEFSLEEMIQGQLNKQQGATAA